MLPPVEVMPSALPVVVVPSATAPPVLTLPDPVSALKDVAEIVVAACRSMAA